MIVGDGLLATMALGAFLGRSQMESFERSVCIIAAVYALMYGVDVVFNIYRYLHDRDDDSDDEEELPEHIKRMYS